nr:hypothetical protein HmN_000279000 [Hymenolepis microstoma]
MAALHAYYQFTNFFGGPELVPSQSIEGELTCSNHKGTILLITQQLGYLENLREGNLVHQEQDGRVTIEEMANEVGIAHESAFSLLTRNPGLRASSPWARWIPKPLQKQQLTQRTQLSLPNLAMMEANEDNFLSAVLPGMEPGSDLPI